ncbi:aldo/keto reductase [Aestuariimicrobium kwangyangense]|uniref:aldo/keto reductase n=1 Tax=Aestuariimicrobium kwangyangense TaxID=396389 RepID=UPI0003B56F13|nr:aldo/keto reductase [Aestuariimicrobium kwangyangense]
MQYRNLGDTGVQVSTLCLGTMMFGGVNNGDRDDCVRIIHTALDSGINFVDTADVYSQGESEEIVGQALKGRRDDVVLATKFQGAMGDERNRRGASRRWIVRSVEDSLRRLGTDHIDLYQLHRPNPDTNIEETLGALDDLVRQGKVLYVGHSAFQASQIVEAQWAARDRGTVRPVCEQLSYSLLVRLPEVDVLPTTLRHHMGVICYSPLAGGWLSGKWRKDAEAPTPSAGRGASGVFNRRYNLDEPANAGKLEAADALASLAEDNGMTLVELAIAFVVNHPAVTSAIIGPRTMEQLTTQVPAADLTLSAEVLDRIDEIVAPGTTPNPFDSAYVNPALQPEALRR